MIGDEWIDLGVIESMTWIDALVNLGQTNGAFVLLGGGSKLPAPGTRARLIKSIDSGETWTDNGTIGPAGSRRVESFCNRGGGRIFAGVGNTAGAILESTDWGDSWIQRWAAFNQTYALENCEGGVMCSGHMWGAVDRLGRSINDGLTWVNQGSITALAASITSLLFIGGNILLAGTTRAPSPAKICRSNNKGLAGSWVDVFNGGAGTGQVQALAEGEGGIIVAGQDFRIRRSSDGGLTWVDRGQVTTGVVYGIEYFGDGVFLGVCGNGNVVRSTDNGLTWTDLGPITSAPPGERLVCIVNVQNTLTYAGSDIGHLYKSGALIPPPELGAPHDLLCEQKTNPTDVTDPNPEFSAKHSYG